MVFLTEFTTVVTRDEHLNSPVFTAILLTIVFGWLLISVFQRVLENFVYETLGLNSRSTIHALIVAVLASVIFVSIIWMINEYKIVPKPESECCDDTENGSIGCLRKTNSIKKKITGTNRFGHPVVLPKGYAIY